MAEVEPTSLDNPCCPTGRKGAASVLVTEKDMDLLKEKGWKIIAGWLLSPQAQAGMELLPKIGVQGPVGPSFRASA